MFMGPCILVYNDHINNQMNTAPYGILSEAGDHHAKHSALAQRPRYINTHRHPTGKILTIPKINKNSRDLQPTIQDSA